MLKSCTQRKWAECSRVPCLATKDPWARHSVLPLMPEQLSACLPVGFLWSCGNLPSVSQCSSEAWDRKCTLGRPSASGNSSPHPSVTQLWTPPMLLFEGLQWARASFHNGDLFSNSPFGCLFHPPYLTLLAPSFFLPGITFEITWCWLYFWGDPN